MCISVPNIVVKAYQLSAFEVVHPVAIKIVQEVQPKATVTFFLQVKNRSQLLWAVFPELLSFQTDLFL